MRRVARSVGSEAMSLYHHVSSKDDLLDAVADLVYSSMTFPELEDDWRDNVRAWGRELRRALLAHPNLVGLVATRPVMGNSGMVTVEVALAGLVDIGFEPEDARQVLNILVSFIFGHAITEVGALPALAGHSSEEVEQFRRTLPSDQFPNVLVTIGARPPDRDAEFSAALEMLIVGIEKKLEQQ